MFYSPSSAGCSRASLWLRWSLGITRSRRRLFLALFQEPDSSFSFIFERHIKVGLNCSRPSPSPKQIPSLGGSANPLEQETTSKEVHVNIARCMCYRWKAGRIQQDVRGESQLYIVHTEWAGIFGVTISTRNSEEGKVRQYVIVHTPKLIYCFLLVLSTLFCWNQN